ncbi:hypothetical protein ACWEO4_39900, partial [Streptomyces sp. NPDC004393]
ATRTTPTLGRPVGHAQDDQAITSKSSDSRRVLSPEANRRANLRLGRGSGMRVRPGRHEEFDQLHTDYFAVWDRSRAYAAAVLALQRART